MALLLGGLYFKLTLPSCWRFTELSRMPFLTQGFKSFHRFLPVAFSSYHLSQVPHCRGLSFPESFAHGISYGIGRADFVNPAGQMRKLSPQARKRHMQDPERLGGRGHVRSHPHSALPAATFLCCLCPVPAPMERSHLSLAGFAVTLCPWFFHFTFVYCGKTHVT